MNKIFRSRLWWLVLLVGFALVNWLAAVYHSRIDLTKEKRYTLSTTTLQAVKNLEDAVTVDVFLKGDYPAGFKKLAASTEEFLRVLKEENAGKINYHFISPEENIAGTQVRYGDTLVAMGANPINLTVQIKSGQENKLVFPFALITYQGRQTLVDLYSGGSRIITPAEMNSAEAMMEFKFLKAFNDLSRTAKPFVAYSTGNGEPTDARTYDLQQTLQKDYQLFTLDINREQAIPDTFKVLMIVKPSLQFSDDEKLRIDQYLMRGGKLLFFIDGLYAEQDSLRYKPKIIAYDRDLNLDDLLFRYGMRINPDLIMDLQCDYMPFAVGGNAGNPQFEFLHWNYYPLFESANNHLINKNIGLVAGRFVNSIDTVQAAGIDKTILLSSSHNSRIISTPALISLNENRNAPEDAKFNQQNIPAAVLLEGEFKSLYNSRISKAKMDSMAAMQLPFRNHSVPSKIIVVADGDMVLNDVSPKNGPLPMGMNLFTAGSQYEYQFANKEFLLNALEYLTNQPDVIAVRNKDIVLRLLDTEKVKEEKTQWQLINIGVPIILVILAGLLYQQQRKRKYGR